MFPIGDDNSARRTVPVVTYGLILLNVLMFLFELSAGEQFIVNWSIVPRRLLSNPAADFPTIFTSMFMHGGWMHLLGNMLYLWIFGDNVEDALGHVKYLFFYLICGLAADFAQIAIAPNSNIPNLGASGAIAGVLAGYLVLFPKGTGACADGQRRHSHARAYCDRPLVRVAVHQRHRLNLVGGRDGRRGLHGAHRRLPGGSRVGLRSALRAGHADNNLKRARRAN
jgi:hypothetical protein